MRLTRHRTMCGRALPPFLFPMTRTQSEIRKYQDVYRLYEFPRRNSATNEAMAPRRKGKSADA